MSPRTIFLAKLIGLFTTFLAITMIANRDTIAAAFVALIHDPAALWLAGMIGVAAGSALVLGHNRWSGGGLTVAVTVVGWIVLLKSTLVLALPLRTIAARYDGMMSPAFFYADAAFLLVLGLVLAVAGFRATAYLGTQAACPPCDGERHPHVTH